jgi:superfamily I DNA and/or RNA helicase
VPALLRAPQAVVAGDRRQLPPTTFFANSTAEVDDEDLDETAAVSGYESILDVLEIRHTNVRLRR